MTRALLLYKPCSAHLLALCLKADKEREGLQRYMADALWLLLKWIAGDKTEFPQYAEWAKPKPADTRTAEEIKNDILRRLLEG